MRQNRNHPTESIEDYTKTYPRKFTGCFHYFQRSIPKSGSTPSFSGDQRPESNLLHFSPQPPPPGVSMRTVSPFFRTAWNLPGISRRSPPETMTFFPGVPGAPPRNPYGPLPRRSERTVISQSESSRISRTRGQNEGHFPYLLCPQNSKVFPIHPPTYSQKNHASRASTEAWLLPVKSISTHFDNPSIPVQGW